MVLSCGASSRGASIEHLQQTCVLRDLFLGLSRFEDIRADLGVATNVLTDRLNTLVEHELIDRRAYQQRPPRYEYVLTAKGRDLFPAITALIRWGDRWGDRWEAGDAGPPVLLVHDDCRQVTDAVVVCARCGGPLDAGNVSALLGPGGRLGRGTKRLGAVLLDRARARSVSPIPLGSTVSPEQQLKGEDQR